MSGEGTKSKYEVIGVLDQIFKHVQTVGYKRICVIWDGAAGENKNKYMYLYIHRARKIYDFEQIRTCAGPPHHLFFFPDTLNAICYVWYCQMIFKLNRPVNNITDLYNLAEIHITEKVRSDENIKMKKITFIDLSKHIYTDTEWFESARMQWMDFSHSKFPHFAGQNVHKEHNTECSVYEYDFCEYFLIH